MELTTTSQGSELPTLTGEPLLGVGSIYSILSVDKIEEFLTPNSRQIP